MVMGTVVSSMRENARKGTCPPLENLVEEADGALNTVPAADVPDPVTMELAAEPAELTGPCEIPVLDVPPDTIPELPPAPPLELAVDEVAPVRIYRSRRSSGLL